MLRRFEVEALLPRLDVAYMKQHIAKFEPKSVAWVNKGDGFQFVRSGQVGESRSLFTAAHQELFDEHLGGAGVVPRCCRDLVQP